MPRPRSSLVCDCGRTGFLVARKKPSKTFGEVVYYYIIHAEKDPETGGWKRVWHYVGADHSVIARPSDRPVKVRQNIK